MLKLLDFYADWCGPCQTISPLLKTFAERMEGKVDVEKVNVDEHQDLAAKYNVMSIPTLVLLKDGKEVDRKSGVATVEGLEGWVSSELKVKS